MHISVRKYVINILYLLHVSATREAIIRVGALHRDITHFCGPQHRGKILSSENKCFKIHIIVSNKDNFFVNNISV